MDALPPIPTQLVGSWCKPQWLCDHDRVYGAEGTWWRIDRPHRVEALDDATRLAICDQHRSGLSILTDGEQRRQTFSGHFYSIAGIDSDEQGDVTNFANDVGEYLTMKQRTPTPPAAAADDPADATDPTGATDRTDATDPSDTATASDTAEPAPPPRFTQPRVVAPLRWTAPILADDVEFLRSNTDRLTKVTIIGPTTLALRLVDEHYGSLEQLAFALADVLNAEARALVALGVDIIQFDEPEVHFRHSQVESFATEALDRAVAGVDAHTVVHVCYGYSKNIAEKRSTPVYAKAVELLAASTVNDISLEYEQPRHVPELLEHAGDKGIALGVLDLDTEAAVETVDHIVGRANDAIAVIGPERLRLAPDCGMWFLPREHATAKIIAMELAAQQLRTQHC